MEHHIAVIGAGPRGTYCLRRIVLYLKKHRLKHPVHVHIIEKSGNFGGGGIHSITQPDYLLLNRLLVTTTKKHALPTPEKPFTDI